MSKGWVRATQAEHDAYQEVQFYTLAHGGAEFVQQHVVDAWAAQQADDETKPISLAFALIGLFLHLERGLSGRQVQRAHMALAGQAREWPSFALPSGSGRAHDSSCDGHACGGRARSGH